jgi:hypothetical protein
LAVSLKPKAVLTIPPDIMTGVRAPEDTIVAADTSIPTLPDIIEAGSGAGARVCPVKKLSNIPKNTEKQCITADLSSKIQVHAIQQCPGKHFARAGVTDSALPRAGCASIATVVRHTAEDGSADTDRAIAANFGSAAATVQGIIRGAPAHMPPRYGMITTTVLYLDTGMAGYRGTATAEVSTNKRPLTPI